MTFSASCCFYEPDGTLRVTASWTGASVNGISGEDTNSGATGGWTTSTPENLGQATFSLGTQFNIGDSITVKFYDYFTLVGEVTITYGGAVCAD